jgi:2-methylcitrate dehydratase PrpD
MANETATLAAYVAGLKFEDIPPEVLERAKVLTLDFSAARSGARCGIHPSLRSGGAGWKWRIHRIRRRNLTPAVAALLNGALGLLDFDDTMRTRCIRAHRWCRRRSRSAKWSAPRGATPIAIVAGYEVCCRPAMR